MRFDQIVRLTFRDAADNVPGLLAMDRYQRIPVIAASGKPSFSLLLTAYRVRGVGEHGANTVDNRLGAVGLFALQLRDFEQYANSVSQGIRHRPARRLYGCAGLPAFPGAL